MELRPSRLWPVVLVLGWLLDFLFWKKAPGINFALYAALCLTAGVILLRVEGIHPARRSLWLLLPTAFFAVLTFLRAEPLTLVLAYLLTLFLLGLFVVTFHGGRWLEYGLLDYAVRYAKLVGSMIARGGMFLSATRKPTQEQPKRLLHKVGPILRGTLIAAPSVLVFAVLLSSADPIFAQRLRDWTAFLRLERLPEYLLRGGYIVVTAYLLAGIVLHAGTRGREERLIGEGNAVIRPFLGFLEAAIALVSVELLFASFVVVQFQYFFGGRENIRLGGFTYAEYARRGFGELVVVAFFSLLFLQALSLFARREAASQRRAFSGLAVALVGLVLVILASAYRRLLLYEAAYGFSRLRTYTHVFMVWLGLLLVAVMVLAMVRRERAFALAALLMAFGFAGTLGMMNVDRFIARANIRRALAGQELDIGYLATLSDDAVPVLASAFRSPALPAEIRESVGAALACRLSLRGDPTRPRPWPSFHFSHWNADRLLAELKPELQEYRKEGGSWLIAPGGKRYPCAW
ncbi:MAG: DUF4153 domain-containing protein, partial [Chloroflexia bacterium]